MSLGVVFKGSEGIVLAADSRVTLTVQLPVPGAPAPMLMPATYDNATKLLKVTGQDHVAAVTYGVGTLGFPEPRTAHSLLPEFEADLNSADRLNVDDFANRLSAFFLQQWNAKMPPGTAGPMVFIVGGYDANAPYGRVFEFSIPGAAGPVERQVGDFGIQWGGQLEITSRMLNGTDPALMALIKNKFGLNDTQTAQLDGEIRQVSGAQIPYQFLPLQDCIDLSILLIRTTAQLMDYQTSLRGVGGAIDVATITRQEGFRYVQRKEIRGDRERT